LSCMNGPHGPLGFRNLLDLAFIGWAKKAKDPTMCTMTSSLL
jgi:hypothetical protein